MSYLIAMPYGCFNKKNYIDNKIYGEPDDPSEIVSEIVQSHPVWDTFNSPSLMCSCARLKPVCSTENKINSKRQTGNALSKYIE